MPRTSNEPHLSVNKVGVSKSLHCTGYSFASTFSKEVIASYPGYGAKLMRSGIGRNVFSNFVR